MQEKWKSLEFLGHPQYSISTYGNLRGPLGIRKTQKDRDGYLKCLLRMPGGIRKDYRISRLVALAFIDNPDNLPEVDHKDRNKQNNNVDNLEWVTGQENTRRYRRSIGGI